MEKNRIRPVKAGKGLRMSYSRQKEVLQMPNLIEVQKNSYQWFLDEGLKEAFADISPITDYSGHLSLDFVDFTLCEDDVKYTIPECKERDATYAAPLKVKVRLHNKETDEINEHEIFMGDLPLMTETGTFVINGAERVIVSQLVRSPGIYYGIAHDKVGKTLYSCTVIPNRGAWLEYETDSNDVFSVRVDRTRKVPITVLLRALGVGTNQQIIDMFGEEPKILASLQKDPAITEREPQGSFEAGLLELYKKIRPGEPLSVESAESLITAMFFDPRRYDLAKVFANKRGLHFFYSAAEKSAALMNMGKLGVLELQNRCYRELSGGQQQRVLLARALCAADRLLILDEPVTGLDPAATQDLYKTLRYLNEKEKMAVIMVTHDMRGALREAHTILHIGRDGWFFGTVAEYLVSPAGKRFGGAL